MTLDVAAPTIRVRNVGGMLNDIKGCEIRLGTTRVPH